MVRCVVLDKMSNVEEIKFRLNKNISFENNLEKKITEKGTDKLQLLTKYNYLNYELHLFGYLDGTEDKINNHYIPEISDEKVLYGDVIICKYKNNSYSDLKEDEYEKFYINYSEGKNTVVNQEDEIDNIESDFEDDEDDSEEILNVLNKMNNVEIENKNDINDYEPESDLEDDDEEKIINNKDIINNELIKEPYNYTHFI